MAVVRVFSANPVSDTLLDQGTFNPDSISFDDGTFWTAGQDYDGVFLTHGNGTLGLGQATDPAVIEASDIHGNKAANLAYVGSDGHVHIYREDVTGSTGYAKDIGAGYNPDIAVSGYATHTAVAYQYDYSGTDTDIFVSFRDENGNLIKSVVVDDTGAKDQNVHIANAYGGFLVTWNRIATNGATSVWYARYDFNGTLRQSPTLVDSAGTINGEPAVSDTRDARFAIAYEDNEFGGDSEIRLFTQGDGGVSTYTRVTNRPGRDHQAAMTELDGILAIAFTHDYLDGGDVRERDIYLALADSHGNMLTDPAHPIAIAESESVKEHVSIDSFDFDKGQVIVSYYDPFDGQVHQKIVGLVETITGDSAANFLRGTTYGIVRTDGGAGNDSLTDSNGPDQLRGGANDDTLYNGKGDDLLDGGTGIDTVSMQGAAEGTTLAINLGATAPQDTGVGMDTILNIENAIGHVGVDTLRGNAAANVLDDGGDVYSPSARDTLIGGGGNDTYVSTNATDIIIEAAGGAPPTWSRAWSVSCFPTSLKT